MQSLYNQLDEGLHCRVAPFTVDHDSSKNIFNWYASDKEELYKKNLKSEYELLKKYNWIDTEIQYKINSQGFRCNNFNEDKGIVFLGCSTPFGVGINVENTFPYLLSKRLNLECWNLSIPGVSNDTSYRIAKYWIPKLNVKIVYLILTYPTRREWFMNINNNEQFETYNLNKDPILINHNSSKKWFEDIVKHDINNFINVQKNVDAIKSICKEYNCLLNIFSIYKWLDYKLLQTKYSWQKNPPDMARDLIHFGIDYHKEVFLNLLKQHNNEH